MRGLGYACLCYIYRYGHASLFYKNGVATHTLMTFPSREENNLIYIQGKGQV
jgi:hypothetical protein